MLFGGYWLPSGIALAYVGLLKHWHDLMLADRIQGLDPFKRTSWIPSITASAVYLMIVLITRRALTDRQAYNCKKYMSVYNLYQVLTLNPWPLALSLGVQPDLTLVFCSMYMGMQFYCHDCGFWCDFGLCWRPLPISLTLCRCS